MTMPEKELYYDIEDESRYHITLSKAKELHELGDHFISRSEFRDEWGGYIGDYGGTYTNRNLIEAQLKEAADKILSDDYALKSIDLPSDLVTALKDADKVVTDYLYHPPDGHWRRRGNKLCLASIPPEPIPKAPPISHRKLVTFVFGAIKKRHGLDFSGASGTVKMILHTKKLCSWKNVCDEMKNHYYDRYGRHERKYGTKEDKEFFKKAWDNPQEYFNDRGY